MAVTTDLPFLMFYTTVCQTRSGKPHPPRNDAYRDGWLHLVRQPPTDNQSPTGERRHLRDDAYRDGWLHLVRQPPTDNQSPTGERRPLRDDAYRDGWLHLVRQPPTDNQPQACVTSVKYLARLLSVSNTSIA